MLTALTITSFLTLTPAADAAMHQEENSLTPVPFTSVHVEDDFWAGRIETNRRVTIPYDFEKCEETGRIANFARAGGLAEGEFEGIYYNDSDLYKVIEGAAYALAQRDDPELDAYLDDLIAKIAAAQEPDGYLNTYHTLVAPDQRWTNIRRMHELYCAGHLFEAAVAHYRATGKRSLLDVALRLADHIDSIFGPDGNRHPPGHQEIEIGLVKLYDVTTDERYLDLAQFFIDQRGNAEGRELYGQYAQDHAPVVEQDEPTGHAVRAMYLYAGMADVAALTGNRAYLEALDRLWTDQVDTKMYITGGVGSSAHGEAFGDDYELPNTSAYNETCAAVGNALWNHRMNLLHADAKYADVLERTIYNGFLSGVSLSGDRFFYPNPLASGGSYHRSPWFSTSCCPVNVVRFIPSIPGYIYAHDTDSVYINLYVASQADVALNDRSIRIRQTTDYPWDGSVRIDLAPDSPREFDLRVRIPGWATGSPAPGDLYRYADEGPGLDDITFRVNDAPVDDPVIEDGYWVVRRIWREGDAVSLDIPMPVRLVKAHPGVEADRGRVAITRGPIVYCIDATDTDGHVRHLWIDEDAELSAEHKPDLLDGVTVVKGVAHGRRESDDGHIIATDVAFQAIPYYGWDHREPGEMAVWIPTDPDLAEVIPAPTLASEATATASFCYQNDSVDAVNDLLEPTSSIDHSIPRLTFWPHLGAKEWVQLEFDEPTALDAVELYWFDDTGRGQCRVPAEWTLLYRDGDTWKRVRTDDTFGVERDTYNRVEFQSVITDALRVEIQCRPDFSAGVLEWTVE